MKPLNRLIVRCDFHFLGWEARGNNNYITIGTSGYNDQNFDEKYGRVIVLGIKSKQVINR
jgi:hypothetical protein